MVPQKRAENQRLQAEVFLRMADLLEREFESQRRGPWTDRLEEARSSILESLEWCAINDPVLGLRLTTKLVGYWVSKREWHLGWTWLDRFVSIGPRDDLYLQGRARIGIARLATGLRNYSLAENAFLSGIDLLSRSNDEGSVFSSRLMYAKHLREQGRLSESETLLRSILEPGLPVVARERIERIWAAYGTVAYLQGDPNLASRYLNAALPGLSQTVSSAEYCDALAALGGSMRLLADFQQAHSLLGLGLRLGLEAGDGERKSNSLVEFAFLYACQGRHLRSVWVLSMLGRLTGEDDTLLSPVQVARVLRLSSVLSDALGESIYLTEWERHSRLGEEQALGVILDRASE